MKKRTAAIAVAFSVILGSCGGSQGTVFISESDSTVQSEASEMSVSSYDDLTAEEKELLERAGVPGSEGTRLTDAQSYVLDGVSDMLNYIETKYQEKFIVDYFHSMSVNEDYDSLPYSDYYKSTLYSKALDAAEDDKSKVNQSSIIFSLIFQNRVFLFTGDAGRESLKRIILKDDIKLLNNISWLKVPHHGSKHNLDNYIINYFHPAISYISSEKFGKYANRCTKNALKKVGVVYTTFEDGSIGYHF